jgi:sulfopyruvate decarboxylase TPP-binding subunit
VLDGRPLARGTRLEVRVDGVERDQLARELHDVVHGRVYGITEMPWQHDLADGLVDAGVEVAAWVPDKRLAPIGERLVARGLALRTLTREEECFGYAAGYRAAGGMPLVLLQCSGLGNAFNALGSLVAPYGFGFPAVVSMRGTLGERNPAQMPLGRTTAGMLELLGVQPFPLARPDEAGVVARGAVASAEGARVLAPIILESILDLT